MVQTTRNQTTPNPSNSGTAGLDTSAARREMLRQSQGDDYSNLIASDRVEGTAVYRPDGEKIGKVERFMVEKKSGVAEYAVMSFGGFLGMGKELRPIPWDALDYDTKLEGYVVTADEDVLKGSPSFDDRDEPAWTSDYATRVYGHYGIPY